VTLADGRRLTLARDGVNTVDAGPLTPDAAGVAHLALDGPVSVACDAVELASPAAADATVPAAPTLAYTRQNAGRYALDLPKDGGYLIFSEAYHPGWRLTVAGQALSPVKGLGFINIYALPPDASGPAELLYRDEAIMARLVPVMNTAWIILTLTVLALFLPDVLPGRKANGGD